VSSVVKTRTPFLNMEILMQALDAISCAYTVGGNNIITKRTDYRGQQKFVFQNGKYLFQHEDGDYGLRQYGTETHNPTHSFLAAVEKEYNAIYKRRLEELERKRLTAIVEAERKKAEEEKQRLERERKEFVAKQRAAIIEKAKEQGYNVQETVVDNKIKLVLVQTTY
jgi:DNA-binding transcriptional regulator YhcF (GntR family)